MSPEDLMTQRDECEQVAGADAMIVLNALHRVESKIDAFGEMLEQYRPLLDAAQARLKPRRWGGTTRDDSR